MRTGTEAVAFEVTSSASTDATLETADQVLPRSAGRDIRHVERLSSWHGAVMRAASRPAVPGNGALGAFYRRLAARIGKPQAITATARKLAILVYRALKGTLVYRDPGADQYNARQRARAVRCRRTQAATLGFDIVNRSTGEVLGPGVS